MSDELQDYNEREYIVATDGKSVPMCDLPEPGLFGKFLRKPQSPMFAAESRRIIRVESEQIPKRIMKHFKSLQNEIAPLGYKLNFCATTPVIGPVAISMMSLATTSGQNSFFAVRSVIRCEGELLDNGFHGFCSFLDEDNFLVTTSPANLPKPRTGVDRSITNLHSVEALVREHRIRMRDHSIVPCEADEIVDRIRRQNLLDLEDYISRGLLRPATTGEIARIRKKSRR